MSQSEHPIALDLERRVGGTTKLLTVVMARPLVDGLFPALVLAGALETVGGIIQVGLLVFGGSATCAVVLAEMHDSPRERVAVITLVGMGLVVAGIEAALAPTIAGMIDLAIFERFAAHVLLAVAARTASARVGDLLPRPAVIVGLGSVARLDLSGVALVASVDTGLVLWAGAAAGVDAVFAAGVAALEPVLREVVDLDRFRFGSAVTLGTLPLSLLGLLPGNAPLAVLAVTAVLSFDPAGFDGWGPGAADAPRSGEAEGADRARAPWL